MGSLKDFSRRIKTIAATVEKGGPEVARKTAAVVLQTVVMATPVGNTALWSEQSRRRARPGYAGGRARANWHVSLGHVDFNTTEEHDAGGQATIGAGNDIIKSASNKGDVEIHIVNNLPYIVPLNEGHSKQAPAAFVELAVANAVAAIKSMKVL